TSTNRMADRGERQRRLAAKSSGGIRVAIVAETTDSIPVPVPTASRCLSSESPRRQECQRPSHHGIGVRFRDNARRLTPRQTQTPPAAGQPSPPSWIVARRERTEVPPQQY